MKTLVVTLAFVVLLPCSARAVYQCGANKDTCICGGYDPYPCCSNGGNCTWWAWEAACCNWGVALPSWGNATDWAGNARARGYDVRGTPVTGTIGNEGAGWNSCYGYTSALGHVAWVDGLISGGVHVSEQNCDYGRGSAIPDSYRSCFFTNGYIARGGQVQCNPGDYQVQGCGGCGTQSRGCGSDGRWGGWSGCGGGGACSPGQTQAQGCGNCGSQTRSCNGSCQWNGWGSCGGQGECAPGQTESQACCDCGSQQRTCSGACHWSGYGACEGPDPAGAPACDTGKLGVCADGQTKCVDGCLACVQLHEPSPETCDAKDDDCNGQVDEGSPKTLASPPPPFAASIVDASYPRTLAPGASGEAWVELRNDGSEAWKAGDLSLRADAPASGKKSALAPEHGWPAFDVAAVLDADVAPGGIAVLRFPIRAGSSSDIDETFTLDTPKGQPVACPEATLHVAIATADVAPSSQAKPLSSRPAEAATTSSGCASFETDAFALLVLLGLLSRRRRA